MEELSSIFEGPALTTMKVKGTLDVYITGMPKIPVCSVNTKERRITWYEPFHTLAPQISDFGPLFDYLKTNGFYSRSYVGAKFTQTPSA